MCHGSISWTPWIADRTDCAQLSGDIVHSIFALVIAPMQSPMTPTQGQYLAFIYAYTRVLRRPPAEADIQKYFEVTPPTVHQMLITLERKGPDPAHTRRRPQHRGAGRARLSSGAALSVGAH